MPSVLWRSEELQSLEQCELTPIPGGHRLSGLVLAAVERRPMHLVYEVDVDEAWRTRVVRATLFRPDGPHVVQLVTDGGGAWQSDGGPEASLDGCLDVDLQWTPATNTLPIRRIAPDVGGSASLAAAWIRFPSLHVERLEQTYERLDERRWRYRSNGYEAELVVDSDGLVLDYADIWHAVGHSDVDELGPETGRNAR